MTIARKMLEAAAQFTEPFTAEQLSRLCWLTDPKTFGLRGFEDQLHDHHRVLSALCGAKGLVQRGWLAREGKLYTLTAAGKALIAGAQEETIFTKPRDKVTFADCCQFWRLTGTYGEAVDRKLQAARARLQKQESSCDHPGLVEASEARLNLLAYFEERFAQHLNVLRRRTA